MSSETLVVKSKDDIIQYVDRHPTQHNTALLVAIVLGGMFLSAYDLTILGTATDQLTSEFSLSSWGLSVVMTLMPVGALMGAYIGGFYADRIGRKLVFTVCLVLLIVSSVGAALAPNPLWLGIFRLLMGFGIGLDAPVASSLLAEFSSIKDRGRNVNYWQVVWYISVVFSSLIVMGLHLMDTGVFLWRWSVGVGAVLALILLILRLMFVGESPMWAAKNQPLEKAVKVLEKHYNISVKLEPSTNNVEGRQIVKLPLKVLFNKRYRSRTIMACVVASIQSLQYYAVGLYIPLIAVFIMGEGKLESLLGTAIVNVAGIVGALTGVLLTTKFGVRKLTIIGFSLVIFSMVVVGITFGNVSMGLIAVLIGLFLFGHSGGPGPSAKTIGALSYPTSLRGYGTGFVESIDRIGSIIGTFSFPVILSATSLGTTMLIIAIFPVIGLATMLFIKWEPVGKDIEKEDEDIEKEMIS